MADWEEVKRLAADFQKVQLSSTTQKLSERNCVEIVSWLLDKKLVDLIFTSDGKEYLTPSQLVQDIKSELYVNGGRINLVELAKLIGVDLAHISAHIHEVLRGQKDIHSILGQLIDTSYITKISGEINEKLSQQGQINVSDLTIQYDLPAEFLQQIIEKNLGKLIFGKQDKNDPRIFFTESFIARSKAKIRGALGGLTRPTTVASILSHIDISEKLFFTLFDQTSMYGSLTSRLVGAQYIPNVYARSQNEWVQNFYKQNGYLEFDALVRIGISDYKSYIKKQLANEPILQLNSCVINQSILDRTEADIEECISSKSYVDLQTNLPSVFNEKDIKAILEKVLTAQKLQQTLVLNSFVISKAFIETISKDCDALVEEKAKTAVESGRYQQYQTGLQASHKSSKFEETEEKVDKREERRKKAAGGKTGGGTQGRETKTKSTKKPNRGSSRQVEDDAEGVEKKPVLDILTEADLTGVIQAPLEEEGLDELLRPIVEYLLPKLNERGLETASNIYATTVANRTASRRQTHNEVQNKLNMMLGDVRLYEKGVKLLPPEVQPHLYKYLLKTQCTDILSEILNYVAAEQNLNIVADSLNADQRLKFINELPQEFKAPLVILNKTLNGQGVDEFMTAVEETLPACSMIIKKIDKKKDRTTVLTHKHELLEKLNACSDVALVLHLAVLVIFTAATQSMLHASGRHLSSVLTFLKQYLSEEQYTELMSYHDFVTLMLSAGSEAENAKEKLKEKFPVIVKIANEYKKPGAEK